LAALDFVLGHVHRGDANISIEERLSETLGTQHAVCMPQARVGIYLAVKALIKEGQKVIMSPYTIYDVVNMVIAAGGRPVFADIETETCNIDPAEIEKLIDDDTGAVLVTHLNGLMCDMDRIIEICRQRNVPVIEDAAQAFGAKANGRHVGTFGDVGIFSFGLAKNVNSFFGGMVVTDRQDLYRKVAEEIGDFPYQKRTYLFKRILFCLVGDIITYPLFYSVFTYWLFRYADLHDIDAIKGLLRGEGKAMLRTEIPEHYLHRMTPMQARLVESQFDRVNGDAGQRIEWASQYYDGLSGLVGLGLPPLRKDGSHIYLNYAVQVENRDDSLRFLRSQGCDLAPQHLTNTADQACFKDYHRDCPNARKAANSVVLLPTYPEYGRATVQRNITQIRKYFGRS